MQKWNTLMAVVTLRSRSGRGEMPPVVSEIASSIKVSTARPAPSYAPLRFLQISMRYPPMSRILKNYMSPPSWIGPAKMRVSSTRTDPFGTLDMQLSCQFEPWGAVRCTCQQPSVAKLLYPKCTFLGPNSGHQFDPLSRCQHRRPRSPGTDLCCSCK